MTHINTINKEIARKRAEFGLETLSDGSVDYKDLLTKRTVQVGEIVESIRENDAFLSEYESLMVQIEAAIKSDDKATVNEAVAAAWALYNKLDPTGEIYTADKIEVMGYDMRDASLTKDQKRKLRKCYSYEVYDNTDELVTLVHCVAEFLEDVATYTEE